MLRAQKLHLFLIKTGLENHVYHCNLLLQAYIQSPKLSEAQTFLHSIPRPNAISHNIFISALIKSHRLEDALNHFASAPKTDTQSWNIVISGLIRAQRSNEAITHFLSMRGSRRSMSDFSSVTPDNFTYASVIPCCGYRLGRQVHGDVVKRCWDWDVVVGTNLLRMYGEEGEIRDAREVFDGMCERDLVVWNVMISCYSRFGVGGKGLELFRLLLREGVADEYTYAIILDECASRLRVYEATQVHSLIIRSGFCLDCFTSNALLNLYSKCGFVASVGSLFAEMPKKDVVSWTAVIAGFSESGHEKEAICMFRNMRLDDVEPNSFTFGSLFSACSRINAFENGKQFHSLAVKFGLQTDLFVGSAIVDMYSNCGEMKAAFELFQSLPERDVVSWNAIICGFAQNGEATKALEFFEMMVSLGSTFVAPNDVTFVGVLSACSRCGLVKEGRHYFNRMIQHHMIKPKAEHYTCMVDILARAGLLDEAEALILSLPVTVIPDGVMWSALLGGCKLHGDLHRARRVAEQLFLDEPDISSNYVLLANAYTDISDWNDALQVTNAMQARGAEKMMGCSWIEIRNCVHRP